MSDHYEEFCNIYGIEPTCEDCEHFIQSSKCGLEEQGIECDGMSEFTTRLLIQESVGKMEKQE